MAQAKRGRARRHASRPGTQSRYQPTRDQPGLTSCERTHRPRSVDRLHRRPRSSSLAPLLWKPRRRTGISSARCRSDACTRTSRPGSHAVSARGPCEARRAAAGAALQAADDSNSTVRGGAKRPEAADAVAACSSAAPQDGSVTQTFKTRHEGPSGTTRHKEVARAVEPQRPVGAARALFEGRQHRPLDGLEPLLVQGGEQRLHRRVLHCHLPHGT